MRELLLNCVKVLIICLTSVGVIFAIELILNLINQGI
jgi:hypothetical protein